jgi:hypothetical protein
MVMSMAVTLGDLGDRRFSIPERQIQSAALREEAPSPGFGVQAGVARPTS